MESPADRLNGSTENQENNCTMSRTPQQRKLHYRHLMNTVEAIQETEDVGLNAAKQLGVVLKEVNSLDTECKIDERIEHADETLLDCLVISSASSLLKKCIEVVDVFTSTYEQSDFSNKIVSYVKNEENDEIEPDDLLKLLNDARSIIPEVPQCTYVYGAYDLNQRPEPIPKKERMKGPREKFQKKEPEKITNFNKEEDGIEEIVTELFDVLSEKFIQNGETPIKYYDYIIDTDDFAATVENMFYFAFLIRDGRACIDLDSQGHPIIKPVKKSALKHFRDGGGANTQIISYINVEQWKRHKKQGYLQQHRKSQALQ